jgi:hypothetical protein
MTPVPEDNTLESRQAACKSTLAATTAAFLSSGPGAELVAKTMPLIKHVGDLCGFDLTDEAKVQAVGEENLVRGFKDVSDMLNADTLQHYPLLSGLTMDDIKTMRKFSYNMLVGEMFGTDEQITYMNGALPEKIVSNFEAAIKEDGKPRGADIKSKSKKIYIWQAHREMMYAVEQYFVVPFGERIWYGNIPAATTIVLELHARDAASPAGTPEHYVRAYVWTPCEDTPNDCPAKFVTLAACNNAANCAFEDFQAIVSTRVARTGTWSSLCNYKTEKELTAELSVSQNEVAHLHRTATVTVILAVLFCITSIVGGVVIFWLCSKPRFPYETVPDSSV